MEDGRLVPFQDGYPDDVACCFGCGRLNEHGHRIKSFWEGEEAVCRFVPEPYHTAVPGYVYGGLIASLIDCHGTGTAAAAACRAEGGEAGAGSDFRFVTASLHVEYKRPTPLGPPIELRARVSELKGRKVTVTEEVIVNGELCATGVVVAVRMPEHMRS